MNERIRELAQEVFSFKYKSNPNELNPDHNMDHIHKFAKLIVRESIEVMKQNDYHGEWLGEKIKEHFGIKE